uniref:Uncharacterized protein n=1 Tax=Anopheles dirus TaxID=7168 RepID=A0A182NT52_9DIPT
YGGPPQSTIGNSARRIQAQLPAEPPACVQNAMMRRDKQPFTYTPGGIDLSQIKSPRMAKRISRNANSEGVTGQPKVSPLAQVRWLCALVSYRYAFTAYGPFLQNNGANHSSNGTTGNGSPSSISPAATLGAAAMGMPFQVFPTGPPAAPPPPPPPTGRVVPSNGGNNRSIPPPPPPPGPGLPAQPIPTSSAEARRSPRPQSFEPPPMGMRPEIKIPANPMAALRKAPRPQPKNDFWIEEYRREKQPDGPTVQIPRPVPPSYSYTNRDLDDEVAKNTFNRTDELTVRGDPLAQQKRSPSPSNLTKPHENGSRGSSLIKTPPVYGQSPVPANLPPPITPTKVSHPMQPSPSAAKDSPPPPVRPKPSLSPVSTTQSTNHSTTQSAGGRDQTAGVKAAVAPPAPPPPPPPPQPSSTLTPSSAASSVSPSVSSIPSSAPAAVAPSPAKPAGTQRPAAQALGSLYIPPIHEVFANSKQSLLTQASPPWMSSRHNSLKEQPEWVHKDEQDSSESNSHDTGTQPPNEPQQSPEQSTTPQPPSVSQKVAAPPSATGESVASATKPVDSIVTAAPTPVSARPSPAVSSLTQTSVRPVAADVATPAHQQPTPQQAYAPQYQQTPRAPVGAVSQSTVTMPVNRGYPQQAPVYAQAQPVYSTQSPAGTQKERIIPIQIEKSPVQAPATAPNFAPPPYYSPSAQYGPASAAPSSMQSPIPVGFATPHSGNELQPVAPIPALTSTFLSLSPISSAGFTTPTAMFTNPNHFVNQGYNNISYPPTPTGQPQPHPMYQHHQHYPPPQTPPLHHHPMHPQQQQQQRMQQQNVNNVRIVPIKVEGGEPTTVRGPLSNTPAIIQSDPRSSSNTQAWNGNSAPNQSRSFRVLQQITDTLDEAEAERNAKEQSNSSTEQTDGSKQQSSGRAAGATTPAQQQELPDGQLRRLQLSNEDKALMNRVKTQVDGEVYLHNEEDPRYRGAAIPSKAFRYLQNMTDSGQAANHGNDNNGSGNRTQQMFNRGNYNESGTRSEPTDHNPACNASLSNLFSDGEGQPQQYVPPSEQKVEEPKKYTGGSIPSRSFKMLQAMTDAPADPNSSDSEGPSVKPLHGSGTDIRYSPYPYPPQPYYCCPNPNWHYYDPSTNPPYYAPHHPPPHPPHAPGYYYPPMPPPPPGHYDRGGGYYGGFMSPHHFYYAQEPCSPCTPPPYYQLSQPQTAYCEAVPGEAIHTYVITTPPPRIVVTPTPDDSCSDSELQAIREQLGELRHVPGEFAGVEPSGYGGPIPLTRSQSSLKRLSERLTSFNGGCGDGSDGSKSSVRCSPCSPLSERYRTFEESTSSVPSSQSEASDSEDEGTAKPRPVQSKKTPGQSNGHVQSEAEAIRSNGACVVSKERTPVEEEDGADDDEEEEEEEEGESEEEETVGYGQTGNPAGEEHLPHQLSVIFEEESVYGQSTVASRRTSICSNNSSTLSDCSSTLANDLDDDGDDTDGQPGGNRTDDDIDRLDEADMAKSLVSVRLPLKLSFSKSPNNEDIATLVVGESEITGSKEKSGVVQPCDEDSGDESDTEEEESEEESAESSEEETETDEETKPGSAEEQSNEADTDVTVTITIPSLASKSKSNERDSLSRPASVIKREEPPVKPPFKIDYEEASEVSVSVSLPLKPKGGSSGEIVKPETPSETAPEVAVGGEEEEEEVDFWSQIGDEDDYQRPVRSFSRDMWSSREFSVDRQSVWSQDDEEASTAGTTDFWSAENGPTEASDMWDFGQRSAKLAAADENDAKVSDGGKDSLEYWQKENERLVKDLYGRRASVLDAGHTVGSARGSPKDENNNKSYVAQQDAAGVKAVPNDRETVERDSEDDAEDGSESESENDSDEYETSNTSKEESEVEQDAGEALSAQLESSMEPAKKPKEQPAQLLSLNGSLDSGSVSALQDDASAVDRADRDNKKLSVKERISLFETQATSGPTLEMATNATRGTASTPTLGSRLRPLSRQKQFCEESEAEDDSGVTSDMSKHISEVETDSECFPEMRKMTRYQRAATHSRLFKLLQDESNNGDSEDEEQEEQEEEPDKPQAASEDTGRVVVKKHTLKQEAAVPRADTTVRTNGAPVNGGSRKAAEDTGNTEARRDRLTLPISHQSSSGNDSLSSSTSSASPVSGTLQNEKLAEELVQSLLMKKKGRLFRNLPLEKLHAAALKILQEDLESNGTISSTEDNLATVDSTPALTPQEFKSEYPNSYADYYDTWCSDPLQPSGCYSDTGSDCGMVKMFRTVPEHQLALAKKDSRVGAGNGHWSPRCPRVFSNKSIPRLAGVRDTEPTESSRGSRPPSRASSNRSPFTVITPAAGHPMYRVGSPMDASRPFKMQ